MSPTKQHIFRLMRWHFWGSTIFEILKASHQFALFVAMSAGPYGHIGSIFALIYLSANLFGFEAGNALIPFANSIAHSPNRASILTRYLLVPQLLLQCIGGILTHSIITRYFLPQPHPLYITLIIAITTTEGLRMAARVLAHTITDSATIIPIETILTSSYFAFIWIGYSFFGMSLNIQTLLIPYLVTSFIATTYLVYTAYHRPTQLPRLQNPSFPTPKQNIRARFSLTMLHLPKNLFSSNFLIPFFAATFDIKFAGIMKLTSEVAQAIKAVIKSSIGFSANAVFSTYVQNRTQAFNMLWHTLINGIIAAIIISSLGSAPCILDSQIYYDHGILLISFSIICIIDYLYLLYEHFFVVANNSFIIARYRITEAVISAFIIWYAHHMPFMVIIGLIVARAISLAATINTTHKLWNIKPTIVLEKKVIGYAIIAGFILGTACNYRRVLCSNIKALTNMTSRPAPPFSGTTLLSE